MRPQLLALISLPLLGCLAACKAAPSLTYRLTAEQAAWQGYQPGQQLRFINDHTGAVRTYQVTQVVDELVDVQKSNFAYERLLATVQRTDTASRPVTACYITPDAAGPGDPSQASCVFDWVGLPAQVRLPLAALNGQAALDTVGIRLLPQAVFGAATYTQVVRCTSTAYQGSPVAMTIYYAKRNGLVAFREYRTGLWYRVP